MDLTCIHRCGCGGLCDSGHPCPMADNAPPLCAACRMAYNEDPAAYVEYGDHPAGVRRWRELQAEVAAAPPAVAGVAVTDDDGDIPL